VTKWTDGFIPYQLDRVGIGLVHYTTPHSIGMFPGGFSMFSLALEVIRIKKLVIVCFVA